MRSQWGRYNLPIIYTIPSSTIKHSFSQLFHRPSTDFCRSLGTLELQEFDNSRPRGIPELQPETDKMDGPDTSTMLNQLGLLGPFGMYTLYITLRCVTLRYVTLHCTIVIYYTILYTRFIMLHFNQCCNHPNNFWWQGIPVTGILPRNGTFLKPK